MATKACLYVFIINTFYTYQEVYVYAFKMCLKIYFSKAFNKKSVVSFNILEI